MANLNSSDEYISCHSERCEESEFPNRITDVYTFRSFTPLRPKGHPVQDDTITILPMLTSLSSLSDSSRIWIFPADRKLTSIEATELLSILDDYLKDWKAHGIPVLASRELRYDQFLLIAADPDETAPSGCSIDDMTRAIKMLSQKFGVDFFNPMKVFYKVGDVVRVVSRSEFKKLAQEGAVNEETTVFDNSRTSLQELRTGKWELPAGDSWHKTFFSAVAA